MERRYLVIRLMLRLCAVVFTAAPAHGQVQVGELVVTPASDGVTVSVAHAHAGQRGTARKLPGDAQAEAQRDIQRDIQPGTEPSTVPSIGPDAQLQSPLQPQLYTQADAQPLPDNAAPAPLRPAVTRVMLDADALPPPRSRPLPPLPAPRRHDMERDVQTLKAARAAMQLDDELHARKALALR